MKRTKAITSLVGVGCLILTIGLAAPALATDRCNTGTLRGSYVFTQDGFENRRVLVPTTPPVSPTSLIPADRRPFAYAGRETYDGRGSVTGINTVAQARGATATATTTNQPVAVDGFVPYTGTYTVNSNCTVEVIVADNLDPTDPPAPDDPVFVSKYHLFLSPTGDMFSFIVYSAAVVQGGVFIEEAQQLTGAGVAYRVDR